MQPVEEPAPTLKPVTLGMQRVRSLFNPQDRDTVRIIKEKCADLIDYVELLRPEGADGRLLAIAETSIEEAAMWAVKAATSYPA